MLDDEAAVLSPGISVPHLLHLFPREPLNSARTFISLKGKKGLTNALGRVSERMCEAMAEDEVSAVLKVRRIQRLLGQVQKALSTPAVHRQSGQRNVVQTRPHDVSELK